MCALNKNSAVISKKYNNYSDTPAKPLTYNINSNGPSMDPCGSPYIIGMVTSEISLYHAYCFIFLVLHELHISKDFLRRCND